MAKDSTLRGVRVVSLALNLPGPAALMRLAQMGATCTKVNPPAGDPMAHYTPQGYDTLHKGVKQIACDLKDAKGQQALHALLTSTDVLLTSFRPSALNKLGLGWKALQQQYPALSLVSVVGAPGPLAEIPGHDLTYQAEVDLVPGMDLPASLFADMGGAMMASEAVLNRHWGLTQPRGMVGGAHAGYRVYACRNGRVAVAALEPHFAARLCQVAGLPEGTWQQMTRPAVKKQLDAFFSQHTRRQLDALAQQHDIPLHTLP